MDHVRNLCTSITFMLNTYEAHHPDADVNDALSALAWLMAEIGHDYGLDRETFREKIMVIYDGVMMRAHTTRDD